ncbi:MAG TPA: DNA-3-methyladenine glycosylase [Candidatus Angelobacter sp.]|nr:DNA-3-methyladenine glycosylase [Candidatus Angelobacter sp.]
MQPTFHLTDAKLLTRSFFNRDPRVVSRQLLGKLIVRKDGRKVLAGRIVEVEAYLGADDAAAHAAAGRTARNEVLFGPPGHAYVYFIYGVHYCLNISCLPEGDAGCVLIRALEPVEGIEAMAEARGMQTKRADFGSVRSLRAIASGPGKLCQALQITRTRDNGKDMLSPRSDLMVVDDGYRAKKVSTTARIGITKSAEMPLRYLIEGNPFVSVKRPVI